MHRRPFRRPPRACALAVAAALSCALPASAAPAQATWSITGLGGFGSTSVGLAVNDHGQVTGWAYDADARFQRAFVWQDGVLADIGGPGVVEASGTALNNRGQVTGWFRTDGGRRAFLYQDGVMSPLAPSALGAVSSSSIATGINEAGDVAGVYNVSVGGASTPFTARGATVSTYALGLWTSASTAVLNDAGRVAVTDGIGSVVYTAPDQIFGYQVPGRVTALNNRDQLTGSVYNASVGANVAFVRELETGATRLFATPGGSRGNAINDRGQVVGQLFNANGPRAMFITGDRVIDLTNELPAASGWVLQEAHGINEVMQITGVGVRDGLAQGFLMSLDGVVWERPGAGSWEDAAAWSYGLLPLARVGVTIDPAASLTVTGPSTRTAVRSLTIGGAPSGNTGIATLQLAGGTLDVTGGGTATLVNRRGVLTGDGTLSGDVLNLGTLRAANLTLAGAVYNSGTVTGHGRLAFGALVNNTDGTVKASAGQTLELDATVTYNAGSVELTQGGVLGHGSGTFVNQRGGRLFVKAGEASFSGLVLNEAGGRLQLDDAVLNFGGGLANRGQVQVTVGGASVRGEVVGEAGGSIIVSGNGSATFFDRVEIQAGSELRVSSGASAVFFGAFVPRDGVVLTGSGQKFFEGGVSPGDSPGLVTDQGSISFGLGNTFLAEIGGTAAGTGHDKLVVAGELAFGGTLKLVSWDGFTGQAGERYDLFDWGSTRGRFDLIDAGGLQLAPGTVLDTGRLYLDGTVGVTAVPEPASGALMLGGIGALWWARRRRA